MKFFNLFTTRKSKSKMIQLTRKRNNQNNRKIRLIETGGQLPKLNGVYTIQIESCRTTPEHENQHGKCNIKWIKGPKKIYWDYISKNRKPPSNYWYLGDGDYKVQFLN